MLKYWLTGKLNLLIHPDYFWLVISGGIGFLSVAGLTPEILSRGGNIFADKAVAITADGEFHGFEGCNDHSGCCFGNCTHVWNYEHASGFLFGELARTVPVAER